MDALSVAAVTATRRRSAALQGPIPPTDLLVLHSAARLALYVASRHVCDIQLKLPSPNDGMPYNCFQRHHKAMNTQPAGAASSVTDNPE